MRRLEMQNCLLATGSSRWSSDSASRAPPCVFSPDIPCRGAPLGKDLLSAALGAIQGAGLRLCGGARRPARLLMSLLEPSLLLPHLPGNMVSDIGHTLEHLLHLEIGNTTLKLLFRAAVHQSTRLARLADKLIIPCLLLGCPSPGSVLTITPSPALPQPAGGCTKANLVTTTLSTLSMAYPLVLNPTLCHQIPARAVGSEHAGAGDSSSPTTAALHRPSPSSSSSATS